MSTKTLLGGAMGWIDIWKTIDPSGGMAEVYNETLEDNSILNHMVWMPANQGVTHQLTRVSTVPSSSKKRMGVGTAPVSGSAVNAVEETTVNEIWLQVEDEVLQKHPNPEAYLQYQTMLGVQGMMQDVVQEVIYGNRSTVVDQINGLAVRHGSIQTDRKQGRVLSASGSSNANSSIWGVKWGEDGIYMLYPKDHPTAGITTEAFDPENIRDSNGMIMRVVPVRIQMAFGIAEKNRRNIFRLCNIDASISAANWILNVENNLITLLNDCPNDGAGFVLYGNNFVKTQFDIRAKDKGNTWFAPSDPYGPQSNANQTTIFRGRPLYKIERLVANEANVA